MAERARAFADNAPGGFFVDRDCIDCLLYRRRLLDFGFTWVLPGHAPYLRGRVARGHATRAGTRARPLTRGVTARRRSPTTA